MDIEEAELLTGSLRSLFAADPADVPAQLTQLGWQDVAAADPAIATTLLFTEKGRALSSAPLLDGVTLGALGDGADAEPAGLVCYPAPASGFRPSSTAQTVAGVLLRRPLPAERIIVPLAPGGERLAVCTAAELEITPLESLDGSLGWHYATGPTPADRHPGERWTAAIAAAQRALAAEIVGVASRALELAIEHTSSRRQFNAPIAAFQAVRHRLADGYVAIEAARALLDAAFAAGDADMGVAAVAAKASAGRAHQIASGAAIQVCGAMGATLEHPLHRYVNRGAVLDGLLGDGAALPVQLGATLRAAVSEDGQIPLLVEV